MGHVNISLPTRPFIGAAIFYLTLPCILFLYGWCHGWYAWPAIILLALSACILAFKLPASSIHANGKDLGILLLTLLLGAMTVESIGFNLHAPQRVDMWARNPIYTSLVRQEWPVTNAQGEYFVYYMAHWLPPAFFSKLAGGHYAQHLLYLWSLIGVLLSMSLLFLRFKRKAILLALVLFFLGMPGDLFRIPAHLEEIPFLNTAFLSSSPIGCHLIACAKADLSNHAYPWLHQITWTFNHGIPLLLFLSLCFSGRLTQPALIFCSALLFTATPLGAIALLPYLLLLLKKSLSLGYIADHRRILILTLTPCMLLLLANLLYFASGPASSFQCMLSGINGSSLSHNLVAYRLSLYAINAIIIIGSLFTFCKAYRHTAPFQSIVLLIIILPFVWIGCDNNELYFKGSAVLYGLFALLLVRGAPFLSRKKLILLSLYLALSILPALRDLNLVVSRYTWDEQKMQANLQPDWDGKKPEEHIWYKRFWGDSPKELPWAGRHLSPLKPTR